MTAALPARYTGEHPEVTGRQLRRLTPRGLLAFWRCYRAQRRAFGDRDTRADSARTAWLYGPVR